MKTNRLTMLPALALIASVMADCTGDRLDDSHRQISEYAESVATECPVGLDIMGVVDTVFYAPDSASFVYNVRVNERLFPASMFATFNTDLLEGTLRNAAVDDSIAASMMKLMAQTGTTLKVRYVGSASGISRIDSITPGKLMEIAQRKPLSRQDWAKVFLSSLKLQQAILPVEIGDGMVQTGLDLDGDMIVYTITLPDELLPMATPERAPLVRNAMLGMLKATNTSRNFAVLVHNAGYGLEYRFLDKDSRQRLNISIPMDELPVDTR